MSELKESIVVQILKYWPVKYLIVALLTLLVWSGGYHFYRCHIGLNSRFLWGASECIECKVVDSIKHDTTRITKTDTVKIVSYLTNGWKRVSKKADTSKTVSKYSIQGPFNAPTQIGDNNTQNNNFGKPERHVTGDFINEIIALNTKHLPVEIFYYNNTMEASRFANELHAELTKRGIQVKSQGYLALDTRHFPPDKDMQYFKDDTIFQITIWPQK
jgi:hypothetical protein